MAVKSEAKTVKMKMVQFLMQVRSSATKMLQVKQLQHLRVEEEKDAEKASQCPPGMQRQLLLLLPRILLPPSNGLRAAAHLSQIAIALAPAEAARLFRAR
jgi:hypothetical protein